MKIHKVTLSILDFDDIGAKGIKQVIENTKYSNRCISPNVVAVETRDIGEWTDSSPLNCNGTAQAEFDRLFKVD